jgi:LemA protein
MFGYQTKPNFTVENEQQIQQAPNVDFGAPPAQPATAPARPNTAAPPSAPTQPAPPPQPAPAQG